MFKKTSLSGVYLHVPSQTRSSRGWVSHLFDEKQWAKKNIFFCAREERILYGQPGVLYGMHFQMPPHSRAECITCLEGRLLAVVLDLRKSAPTYGKTFSCELNGAEPKTLYIPSGLASGLCVLGDRSAMALCRYGEPTLPEFECGIHYDSFDFRWPLKNPLINARDAEFAPLIHFVSPF